MKTAMREHDELRRDILRMAISAAYNAEKAAKRPLTDEELIGVLAREVKTRRESIVAYEAAGRPDLAAKERAESDILAEYLPAQLSQEEIRTLVLDAIAVTGAASPKDMGRVMGIVAPRTKGRADGKVVSGIVNQEHVSCFYGPSKAYLYKYGLLKGNRLDIIGYIADTGYIEVQAIGVPLQRRAQVLHLLSQSRVVRDVAVALVH